MKCKTSGVRHETVRHEVATGHILQFGTDTDTQAPVQTRSIPLPSETAYLQGSSQQSDLQGCHVFTLSHRPSELGTFTRASGCLL